MINIDMEQVINIVKEASKLFADREAAEHTTVKGKADFVTEVDVAVQNYIQERLEQLYPQIQFLSEEKNNEDVDKNGLVWVLDPVDGTTNLIHDYKASVISLALMELGKPMMGIVYNPYNKELFTAKAGEGCYCNGKKVTVSSATEMEDCLIAIGTSPYYKEMAKKNFAIFEKLFCDCQDIRRTGSAALDLAYVASGRIEGYFERSLKIWDFAAGTLLVQEAGGMVVNYQGEEAKMDMVGDIVAGNRAVVAKLVEKYL